MEPTFIFILTLIGFFFVGVMIAPVRDWVIPTATAVVGGFLTYTALMRTAIVEVWVNPMDKALQILGGSTLTLTNFEIAGVVSFVGFMAFIGTLAVKTLDDWAEDRPLNPITNTRAKGG